MGASAYLMKGDWVFQSKHLCPGKVSLDIVAHLNKGAPAKKEMSFGTFAEASKHNGAVKMHVYEIIHQPLRPNLCYVNWEKIKVNAL